MKTLLLLFIASVAGAQLNKPLESASAVIQLTVTNYIVQNWNVPNAFAGAGAKMKLMREESPARHGAVNFIATSITNNGGNWTIEMVKTNIGGRALLYHEAKTTGSDLLQEPFGFSIYEYFLANGIEVLGGDIALELNGVTNHFAIPPQITPGNQIFASRMTRTNAHSARAIWRERKERNQ